jgi:menaquinone-dependent protoporphyrinogen oxidase
MGFMIKRYNYYWSEDSRFLILRNMEVGMCAAILVAYATRYGSTQEVAQVIAAELRECGLEVDLQPARNVKTLADCQGVVLGAPQYMFHWHKDALHFLSRYREMLQALPVAVFTGGPFHDDEKDWQNVGEAFTKELAKFPWFHPVSQKLIGGRNDPARLRFPDNLFMRNQPPLDIRDWDAIRAWARELAFMFQKNGEKPSGKV